MVESEKYVSKYSNMMRENYEEDRGKQKVELLSTVKAKYLRKKGAQVSTSSLECLFSSNENL